VISKARTHNSQPLTLQGQLSEWQERIQREHPDLWAEQGDLATLDQVEGSSAPPLSFSTVVRNEPPEMSQCARVLDSFDDEREVKGSTKIA
jgi:hypothetical protein